MKFAYAAAVLGVLSGHASSDIIYRGDFESGKIGTMTRQLVDSFYYGAFGPNCKPATLDYSPVNDNRVQSSDVRYGQYANAQTIRYDCDYRPLNEGKYQKPRQSLGLVTDAAMPKAGKEYWLTFSFKVGKDWVSDYAGNVDGIFQIYKERTDDSPNARQNGANAINIIEKDGQFELEYVNILNSSGQIKPESERIYKWPVVKDKWQDVAINFRLCKKGASGCSGFIKTYLNGSKQPVFQDSGYNTQTNLHKISLHIYKYGWHCKSASSKTYSECMASPNATRSKAPRTLYFDEMMLGSASSSIDAQAPWFYGDSVNNTPSPPAPPVINVE